MEFYATLGGSCADRATLDGLFTAGMTGARLNLSHTTLQQCAPLLEEVYWPAAQKALCRTRRSIRVDPLRLSVTLGGAEDPAAAAELYGGLHALVWTGMPALEQLVVIRDPGIHLGIDFDAQETRAEGELGISIRLGTLIAVGTQLAVPAIGWLRRFMKRRRTPPASKAADNKAAEHPAA